MDVNNMYIHKDVDAVKGLYGSEIMPHRACGYCKRHGCYLTVKMLKQHDCLNKQCYHLIRNEEHQWWKQRAKKKEMRKARKQMNTQHINM